MEEYEAAEEEKKKKKKNVDLSLTHLRKGHSYTVFFVYISITDEIIGDDTDTYVVPS